MQNKNIFIGLAIGLVTNCIGLYLASLILGKGDSFFKVLEVANAQGFLNKLISLGAVLNLIPFFYFLSKRQDLKARGVLIATIAVAVITLVIKLF